MLRWRVRLAQAFVERSYQGSGCVDTAILSIGHLDGTSVYRCTVPRRELLQAPIPAGLVNPTFRQ